MCSDVSERPKHPLNQIRRSLLFVPFGLGLQAVESQERYPGLSKSECLIDKCGPISPDIERILSATLLVASKTAWK